MSGDGVKTNRRARSQRNKIVSTLAGAAAVAQTVEQTLPGVVPAGFSMLTGQCLTFAALLVNQFWPK